MRISSNIAFDAHTDCTIVILMTLVMIGSRLFIRTAWFTCGLDCRIV